MTAMKKMVQFQALLRPTGIATMRVYDPLQT